MDKEEKVVKEGQLDNAQQRVDRVNLQLGQSQSVCVELIRLIQGVPEICIEK